MEKVNKNNSDAIKASKIEIQKVIDRLDNAINNLTDASKKSYLKEKLFELLAVLSLFVGGALMFPSVMELVCILCGEATDFEAVKILLSSFSGMVGFAITNSSDIFMDKSIAYNGKAVSLIIRKVK